MLLYIFEENFPHKMKDIEIDKEIRKVVDTAAISSINIKEFNSLRELYNARKSELRLSDLQIQKILGVDKKTIMPIIEGKAKQVNFINVVKLAHFLGLSINDLIKIYIPDMDSKQIGEIQRSREAGFIVQNFDVSILTKINFFKKGSSSKEMSERIKKFFSIEILYDFSENSPLPVYSRTKRDSSELMRNFWIQSAIVQFKEINNPNTYNRNELIELIPKIRPFTMDIQFGLIKVLRALYNVGITVIYQPSIEKIQVRGATIILDKKPCIVISDLQKNYPTLWFTLLHELHHVLFDYDDIEKRLFHISSGQGDLFLMNEEKADSFAIDYLLNESRLKFVSGYITSKFDVERIAKEWGVHTSIIYSIYCYKTGEWPFYNKFIPKMEEALGLLNTHAFEKETLVESAKQLKETIYN